jgi:hypothetical protein
MTSYKQTKQNEVVPLLTSRAALTKLPGALFCVLCEVRSRSDTRVL